jgi:hypothetical protein
MGHWPSVFGRCGLVHQKRDGSQTGIPMNVWDALFFSVETQATIGYSAPSDIFFDDCPLVLIVITFQSVVGLFLDAALLGLLFNRVARGTPRANTILFSDRACVRKIRGRYHLMFQVCEIRKHALIEAHVRVYTVRKDVDHRAFVNCIPPPHSLPPTHLLLMVIPVYRREQRVYRLTHCSGD